MVVTKIPVPAGAGQMGKSEVNNVFILDVYILDVFIIEFLFSTKKDSTSCALQHIESMVCS